MTTKIIVYYILIGIIILMIIFVLGGLIYFINDLYSNEEYVFKREDEEDEC